MRGALAQRAGEAPQTAMFARWSAPEPAGLGVAIGGLGNDGRIGLSPALLNSLAIAPNRDSAPDPVPVVGVFPSP